uniref:Uncharacterized protein n=1 Tax=Felis catus TaxID=9685 RepID=A0ABI7XHU0_FELCA
MEGGKWRQLQRRVSISRNGFYACPGFRMGAMRRTCGGFETLYCAAWSCVPNDGEWKWEVKPQFIEMSYVQPCTHTRYDENCNLIHVRFTEEGKKDRQWVLGLTWGLYLYQYPLFGTAIQIKSLPSCTTGGAKSGMRKKKKKKKKETSLSPGRSPLLPPAGPPSLSQE